MVTQCPICLQWFRIGSDEAEAAHGLARCGECGTVFNALATLRERPPPVRESPACEVVEVVSDDEVAEASASGDFALAPLLEARARRGARWPWIAALVLAALVLAAQLVHAGRYAIARVPVAGSALAAVYRFFGSPLDGRLVLDRYAITHASLETAPGSAGTLLLDGSLINRATFAQRLPLIRIRLSNSRGDTIASRVLLPSDYETTTMSALAARHGLHFHVRLADPGASATGFTLVLCKRRNEGVVCMEP